MARMSPGEIFSRFMHSGTEILVRQTNVKGMEKYGDNWTPLEDQEFFVFLALIQMMGIVQKDQIKLILLFLVS